MPQQRPMPGSKKSLSRGKPKKLRRPRVLIVCEGKETEPNYFIGFRREKRLNKELFTIIGPGPHPKNIVKKAVDLVKAAELENEPFDMAWCVFDRDTHEKIHEAFQKADPDLQIKIAFSNPCFEIWFLLHFQDHSRPEHRDEIIRLLKIHLPDYDKSLEGLYERLLDRQVNALKRAKDLKKMHLNNQAFDHTRLATAIECNPFTSVDCLIEYLIKHFE